jgi:hypothetical protein
MTDDLPQTLPELCDYIVKHASRIAVREQIDGKFGAHYLTDLPPLLAITHALRFVREGRVPAYVRDEGEVSPTKCPDCGGDTHVFVDGDKRWLVCTPGCGWERLMVPAEPPRTSQEDDRG